jgi:putative metallohydrolase (TIGR04338 family)
VTDAQRSRVYSAEKTLRWLYDHPASSHDIGGVAIQLEPEARFASLDSVAAYLDRVISHPAVIAEFGARAPITVRERRGEKSAHYEPNTATIAINTTGTRWSLRECVLLHETAHHYSRTGSPHGPEFTATLTRLIELVMGPQAALALRLLYAQNGAT